jgi:nucleotide-binding universal stress UspA family protein
LPLGPGRSMLGETLKGWIMYKNIVLAYDGSDSGQKALLDCNELAQWSHATLSLVAVMPSTMGFVAMEGSIYDPEVEQRERSRFQAILADGLRRLADTGFTANGELLVGDSVEEITNYARKISADLIVVGHKHLDSWAARWWRGSISSALIEHAPCSVLCVITL